MTLLKTLIPTLALACLPLAARTAEAPGHRRVPTQDPAPDPAPTPDGLAEGCVATGCPKADQHGHAPVKCEFKSSLATGFRCILFCSYPDSQWGSIVDSSQCK